MAKTKTVIVTTSVIMEVPTTEFVHRDSVGTDQGTTIGDFFIELQERFGLDMVELDNVKFDV